MKGRARCVSFCFGSSPLLFSSARSSAASLRANHAPLLAWPSGYKNGTSAALDVFVLSSASPFSGRLFCSSENATRSLASSSAKDPSQEKQSSSSAPPPPSASLRREWATIEAQQQAEKCLQAAYQHLLDRQFPTARKLAFRSLNIYRRLSKGIIPFTQSSLSPQQPQKDKEREEEQETGQGKYWLMMADGLSLLSKIYWAEGALSECETCIRKSLELRRRSFQDHQQMMKILHDDDDSNEAMGRNMMMITEKSDMDEEEQELLWADVQEQIHNLTEFVQSLCLLANMKLQKTSLRDEYEGDEEEHRSQKRQSEGEEESSASFLSQAGEFLTEAGSLLNKKLYLPHFRQDTKHLLDDDFGFRVARGWQHQQKLLQKRQQQEEKEGLNNKNKREGISGMNPYYSKQQQHQQQLELRQLAAHTSFAVESAKLGVALGEHQQALQLLRDYLRRIKAMFRREQYHRRAWTHSPLVARLLTEVARVKLDYYLLWKKEESTPKREGEEEKEKEENNRIEMTEANEVEEVIEYESFEEENGEYGLEEEEKEDKVIKLEDESEREEYLAQVERLLTHSLNVLMSEEGTYANEAAEAVRMFVCLMDCLTKEEERQRETRRLEARLRKVLKVEESYEQDKRERQKRQLEKKKTQRTTLAKAIKYCRGVFGDSSDVTTQLLVAGKKRFSSS
ncbi:hypothetical protein QOT17_013990 [Balamuthia mandrillaris]